MHVSGSKKGKKKNLNFELNLIPFIDVLSVCICFLLVTAVFINLGSLNVSQAVGSSKLKEEKSKGSVTVSLGQLGDVRIEAKDVRALGRGTPLNVVIRNQAGKIDFARLEDWIKSFSTRYTDVKTVMIMPNPQSKYDDLIQIMASFKSASMSEIGIAPL